MRVDLGDVPCAGYASQQFDFPALHAQLSQAIRDLLDVMIEAAIAAEGFPDQGAFCIVIFVGHSDRVDTPGLTSEARRAQELQMSELRAESAQAFFFTEFVNRMLDRGLTIPADQASMTNVDLRTVACGSADLVHLVPSDEQQRKDNRRVHFIGTAFTPD